ncbi:hypothetical protein SDC9_83510 [bioreactor metagenome]|uniref:Bacterial sugar transferase domain-containing protein n=1 Tax=bioreactor metagenome TaxID=1076179 RepID=A0A644Z7S6_9ZZZZ
MKFTTDENGSYYYAVVDDGVSTTTINTDGTGTTCTTGEVTITNPTGLTAGAKDIYIKVKDNAGNVSALLKIDIDAYQSGLDIIRRLSWRFVLVAEVSAIGAEEDIYAMIQQVGVEAVMLCGLASSQRNDILKYCIKHEIRAYVRPNIGDFIMSSAKTIQMANLPVIVCEHSAPSFFYLATKRMMDIVVSLCGLVVAGPVMILTAIAVKAYDHGPVLYKQARITKAGRIFYIYKFRSMQVNAEQDGIARLAQQSDQRITAVGKIIRACRIDELPQILNILGGSMSVVGPRPERPEIMEQYKETLPEFELRLQVKAGLTGYAQVYGKYNTMPYDKLQMDLMYIAHPSIIEDLKIILTTIKILFLPESTEGVKEERTTATDCEIRKIKQKKDLIS